MYRYWQKYESCQYNTNCHTCNVYVNYMPHADCTTLCNSVGSMTN